MKPNPYWQERPHVPLNRHADALEPYICRLAPAEHAIDLEVLDNGAPESAHSIYIRPRGSDADWRIVPMSGATVCIDELESDCDWEFFAARNDDPSHRSALRLARTGFYPDIMVHYVHPDDEIYGFSGRYLCDPTFVRTPSGALVAAMDVYAHSGPQTLEILFRSEDNGKTWRYVCDLLPAYWGTLFMHRGVMYMLCTTTENGHLMIGASYDEGYTWTRPTLLFIGGNTNQSEGFQRQPMPIIEHNGKLITNVEFGSWTSPTRYQIATLSIDAEADLLDPANWRLSEFTPYDHSWPGSPIGGPISLLEGSIFEAKDGKLLNLLRMQIQYCTPNYGKACLLELDPNDLEAAPKFHSIIDMPTGANSRTHILQDPVEGKYWGIGNLVISAETPRQRNIMALVVSDDGYDWRVAKLLLDYRHLDPQYVGFQYTSFIFDGDDLIYISRTSFNGANNYHNANCHTLGVVKNFRSLD